MFTFARLRPHRWWRLIVEVNGMIFNYTCGCAYCGWSIKEGQRWVREKIYEPVVAGRDPIYRRYHAELFDGQELSCWEKQLVESESRRIGHVA